MTPSQMTACLLASALLLGAAPPAPAGDLEIAVAVLDRAAEPGDLIGAGDLIEELRPSTVARGALRARDIAGMQAVRRLPAGSILRVGDLTRAQLVRRGEPVTVTVRFGALTISTSGRALSSGAVGATVKVVTQATGKTLEGRVEGPGTVRVLAN